MQRPSCTRTWAILILTALPCLSRAADWPQWLGPDRDGVWREEGLPDAIDPKPNVRWRATIGGGYAGPAVARGRVFVTDFTPKPAAGKRAGIERVLCLDDTNGKVLWTHEYPCVYGIDYGAGPRATPSVDSGRVYTLGAEGHLYCLDANTGKPAWSKHFAENGAATPTWGYAAHPLVDGNKLICLTGPAPDGKLVTAFDKQNGKVLWTAITGKDLGYCPPVIFDVGGVRQLMIWDPQAVHSLDPETGKVYWSHPFGPVRYGVSIATPRLIRHPELGNLLLISSSWDGSMMLKLDATSPKASVLWQRAGKGRATTGGLHVLMAPAAVTTTHLFGVSNGGELRCLDAANGNVLWETYAATTGEAFENWSTAFVVPAPTPEKSFIFNEHGEMVRASLTPAGYEERGRVKLIDPTNTDAGRPVLWCHPALANGSVYWRNDREIVAIKLKH